MVILQSLFPVTSPRICVYHFIVYKIWRCAHQTFSIGGGQKVLHCISLSKVVQPRAFSNFEKKNRHAKSGQKVLHFQNQIESHTSTLDESRKRVPPRGSVFFQFRLSASLALHLRKWFRLSKGVSKQLRGTEPLQGSVFKPREPLQDSGFFKPREPLQDSNFFKPREPLQDSDFFKPRESLHFRSIVLKDTSCFSKERALDTVELVFIQDSTGFAPKGMRAALIQIPQALFKIQRKMSLLVETLAIGSPVLHHLALALFLCVGRSFVLFFFAFETLRIPRRLTIPKIFVWKYSPMVLRSALKIIVPKVLLANHPGNSQNYCLKTPL